MFIAEKPSVAEEFAKVVGGNLARHDGYREGDDCVVTWCFGHLVTMSYPDAYDEKYKKWRLDTLPFLPETYRYEVIDSGSSRKQFSVVKKLLNRKDVGTIYVCTDSGREGEYIYRLVRQMAGVHDKEERRVWINSQTEEEIRRGIEEAKPLSTYDHLSDAAYLRAKEDYLMGINFSRLLTLKYGREMADFLNKKYCVVSVGRVMTCVLGMVTKREREIRNFVKTPFFKVVAQVENGTAESRTDADGLNGSDEAAGLDASGGSGEEEGRFLECEWRAVEGSKYFNSPLLYKENGFRNEEDAKALIAELKGDGNAAGGMSDGEDSGDAGNANGAKNADNAGMDSDATTGRLTAVVESVSKRQEKKNAPLLYNLAELQNECAKLFKIAPDQTLAIVQELYEKKLVTYPRTDARVLSSAIAKEIDKNIRGLAGLSALKPFVETILSSGSYQKIAKTRYVNDKQITDHYAIIPTGAGLSALRGLKQTEMRVYEVIARRFLAIFLPQAVYKKAALVLAVGKEKFFASEKYLVEPGYLAVMDYSFTEHRARKTGSVLEGFRKGKAVELHDIVIRQGETTPPKRYTTGSMILAMENAGNLIEDEALREEISGSGIGTSATRAEILDKLLRIDYLRKNEKTQILTPSLQGEMVYYVVGKSIRSMLNPELTAGWERGLTYVSEGSVSESEYMEKLSDYIRKWTGRVMNLQNSYELQRYFQYARQYHEGERSRKKPSKRKSAAKNGK